MNPTYQSIFVSRIAAAIGAANATAQVTHKGVKGTLREIIIRDLFRPLLPSDAGIGTGQIATVAGELSSQQDVIIYNRRILPPILYEETTGIFPIESVLATVEVKTTLNASELQSAINAARVIQGYSYLSGERAAENGQDAIHNVQKAISTVFALGSDLVLGGKTEIERFAEFYSGDDPPIRAMCVSGRGYWYYVKEWHYIPADKKHRETMSFIAGLIDTFSEVALTRRNPRLAGYLVNAPQAL